MTRAGYSGLTLLVAGIAGIPGIPVRPVAGQADGAALEQAVTQARAAWLAHDARALVAGSDTLRLQLPGVGRAPVVRPPQAAWVLADYVKSANEISFTLRSLRVVSEDHAYAEMVRVYVVQGTADERVETVFFGFRRSGGKWAIREVRVTP